MQIDLSCSNCSNDYQQNNPPKLLTCGHTFCLKCLITFKQNHQSQIYLVCPQDQHHTIVNQNIQDLPINLALMRLVQTRKKNSSNASNSSIPDASFDMSKINKMQQCQQDQLAQQLISEINRATERKTNLSGEPSQKIQVRTQDTQNHQKVNEKKNKPEQDVCLLHQKPIEVVCMYDYQRLCSKCALFGQHKSHQFKGVEQIQVQNHKSYQEVIAVFESKETLMEKSAAEKVQNDLLQLLQVKTTKLRRQITDYYKKLLQQLQKAEKQTLKQLDEMRQTIQAGIVDSLKPDQKVSKNYDKWQFNTLELIKESQQPSSQGCIKFYLKRQEVLKEGQNLVKQLREDQNNACTLNVQLIEDFNVQFNQNTCQKYFENLVDLINKKPEKVNNQKVQKKGNEIFKQNQATRANCWIQEIKKSPPTLERHESEESLLDACDFDMHSVAGSQVGSRILDQSFVSVQDQHHHPHRQSYQRQHTARPLIKRKIPTGPREKEKCLIKEAPSHLHPNAHNSAKKKAKALKVPQKYEKVIEGIINDSLQTVDFTNAELGDSTIVQILDLMKDNKKVRTLKLIRNKLTDDGITKIIPFLGNLLSLNLSQNVLTDNVLNLFLQNRSNLPQLKSLVLSQTKIVERKSKPLIEKVKKTGLAVSV